MSGEHFVRNAFASRSYLIRIHTGIRSQSVRFDSIPSCICTSACLPLLFSKSIDFFITTVVVPSVIPESEELFQHYLDGSTLIVLPSTYQPLDCLDINWQWQFFFVVNSKKSAQYPIFQQG